jgi:hypothetical protein
VNGTKILAPLAEKHSKKNKERHAAERDRLENSQIKNSQKPIRIIFEEDRGR